MVGPIGTYRVYNCVCLYYSCLPILIPLSYHANVLLVNVWNVMREEYYIFVRNVG